MERASRIPSKQDWIGPVVAIVVALVSLALSGYASYSHNDKDLTGRIIAVETQQKNDDSRLERIEQKVDRLLDRVR
jgi:hypothetical protein